MQRAMQVFRLVQSNDRLNAVLNLMSAATAAASGVGPQQLLSSASTDCTWLMSAYGSCQRGHGCHHQQVLNLGLYCWWLTSCGCLLVACSSKNFDGSMNFDAWEREEPLHVTPAHHRNFYSNHDQPAL